MLELRGKLSIGRPTGGDAEIITIEIIDNDACVRAAKVEISLENFARCLLTGLGHCDCTLEFNDSGAVGKISENKMEMVPTPQGAPFLDEGWIDAALAPFEVDGWRARRSDMTNHHCWVRTKDKKEFQRVVFFRHVERKERNAETNN